MNNKEFLKKIKDAGIIAINNLPSDYDYSIKGKTLILKLSNKAKKGIYGNMQDDSAAFESWSIILKYYCPNLINDVVIDWEESGIKDQHYNRFIYRLTRFVQTYDWAKSAKHIPALPSLLCVSAPHDNTISKKEECCLGSEDWLECDFIERNVSKYDIIDHQLPMGLFDGEASNSTRYTPANNCQLDIWALKGDELSVFELKKHDTNEIKDDANKPLGIISELMFYTNVMCDIIHHGILIDENKAKRAIQNKFRGFDKFYEIYKGTKAVTKIHAVFLAEEFHSNFCEDVLPLINDSVRLKRFNISYEMANPLVD